MQGSNGSKQRVPAALRQSIWLRWVGRKFDAKCAVTWCNATITPFTFEAGHNVPASKGGASSIENLRPICGVCNKSMGNLYTIDEFSQRHESAKMQLFRCCMSPPKTYS